MTEQHSSWKAKALLTLLWANFAFLWIRVYWITTRGDVGDSISYLGGLICAYGILVTLWIYHNVRIYRKKGPRKSTRAVAMQYASDALRRDIVRHVDVKSEQEIAVDIVDGQKVFLHSSGKPQEATTLTST